MVNLAGGGRRLFCHADMALICSPTRRPGVLVHMPLGVTRLVFGNVGKRIMWFTPGAPGVGSSAAKNADGRVLVPGVNREWVTAAFCNTVPK